MTTSKLQSGLLTQLDCQFSYDSADTQTKSALFTDAIEMAQLLPDHSFVINLCADRYHFTVGMLAAIIRQQITLLPSNRQPGGLSEVISAYPDSYYLYDDSAESLPIPSFKLQPSGTDQSTNVDINIPDEQTVCISFTSGSTGKPEPNLKSWKTLARSTELALQRFDLAREETRQLICTVPQQHMYGLETSIFYALLGNVAVFRGKPFFPEDIRAALAATKGDRILVTTPIHLKACVNAGLAWPDISMIISATAPLSLELAEQAEQKLNTRVMEIFGCTEAGSFASRHTVKEDYWTLYDEMQLSNVGQQTLITGPQLDFDVELQDRIEITASNTFKHHGRNQDMVNIAGKRISLMELNIKLNSIPGVVDGVYLQQTDDHENTRLSALIVAPMTEEAEILLALKQLLDPVFLPRPLLKVEKLPRNETGKLPSGELLECFHQASLA